MSPTFHFVDKDSEWMLIEKSWLKVPNSVNTHFLCYVCDDKKMIQELGEQ